MASIVKRKNSYSVVYYDTVAGKQIWESGFTHAEAKDRKIAIEYEQSQERNGEITPILLQDFMQEFIEKYGAKKWGTSYYNSSLGLLKNYIYPYWKEMPVHQFTVKGIDDFYDYLIKSCPMAVGHQHVPTSKKKVTASVVNDIHKLLRCAFNQAKKWQYISINPFLDATVPEYKMKERPALTPKQLEEVFEFIIAYLMRISKHY